MAIRITGMNSGLDTESIITELVKAQKTKSENVKRQQTKLEWKKDAWKELNTKIYKLFNGTLNNLRIASDYYKKTTTVSDESVASVITGSGALEVAQTLTVEETATSGYLTGAELKGEQLSDGTYAKGSYTGSSKVSEVTGIADGGNFKITSGDGTTVTNIAVTENMTINELVAEIKKAGVEASFDEKNQRFFIASKATGIANDFKIEGTDINGTSVLNSLGLTSPDAKKITATDAKIVLNDATYTSSTNTFEINGLTITALAKSDKKVTLNTKQDTDGIYDMIKNFFKEYNTLISEMDSLYNAESTKDYQPLTEDEKSEMSDSEVEKWEEKIKESVLRNDSNLSTVSTAMKTIMLEGVSVNGKQMYLSNFGIETLGYFSAEENERNAYHINGDEDDSAVSSKENQLKAMIASEPDMVVSFFSQLTQKLYTELNNQSRSVEGIRSFGSFYDDKRMETEYSDYKTKIKEQEDKLTAMEDRWYSKFSAMETALAKLQSNQSAVSGMLGY